jgi:putative glutamine amidotransferase
MMVNSYHHQGIKRLSDQLVSAAKAEDGLTEAVYMPGKRFIWAVQWHPEFVYRADENNMKLFIKFVKTCGEKALPRQNSLFA